MKTDAKSTIETGKAILGIEFGSTRIKAVLIDPENHPIAQGSHTWENQLVDGLWTYSIEEICYMAFDKNEEILVPFRTWRNTNTGQAAAALSELFVYNIPLRWSISHLYQAILNNEKHVNEIDFLTTLAGYVHWQLTGEKVLGIGDASGMLPIDPATKNYSAEMVAKFDKLVAPKGYSWKLEDILPKVLNAGENAGCLTPEGVKRLDVSGNLKAGIPLCPPEGDAGTGMVATNAVKQRTGNVSAGTSSFSMIVLEKDGNHAGRKPRRHGTLQQLYFRPQRMGQPFQGVPRTSGPARRYGRHIRQALQPRTHRPSGLRWTRILQLFLWRTCYRTCRRQTFICPLRQ